MSFYTDQYNKHIRPQPLTDQYQTPPNINQPRNISPSPFPRDNLNYQAAPRRYYGNSDQDSLQQYSPSPHVRPILPIQNDAVQSIQPARTIPSVHQMNFTPEHYNHQDNLTNSRMEQLPQNEWTFDGGASNEIKRLQQQLEIKERIIKQLADGQISNQNQNQGDIMQLENEKNGLERQAMNLTKELGEKDKIIRQLQQKINDLHNNNNYILQEQNKDQEILQLHMALEAQNDKIFRRDEKIELLSSKIREIEGVPQGLYGQLRLQQSTAPKNNNPLGNDNKDQEIMELKKKLEKYEMIFRKVKEEIQDKDDRLRYKDNQIAQLTSKIKQYELDVQNYKYQMDKLLYQTNQKEADQDFKFSMQTQQQNQLMVSSRCSNSEFYSLRQKYQQVSEQTGQVQDQELQSYSVKSWQNK